MGDDVMAEIHEALARIMEKVPAIPKGQRNEQQNYAFRGIDDVYNALHPLLSDEGIFILPEVIDAEYIQQPIGTNKNLATDARLRIKYRFVAKDGSEVELITQGESRDYSDKATNQAMSSGFKYGLLQMFLIPLEGVTDGDSVGIVGETAPPEEEISPERQKQRHENAVKAQMTELFGNERAAELWFAAIENDLLDPDQIFDWAREYELKSKRDDAVETAEANVSPLRSDEDKLKELLMWTFKKPEGIKDQLTYQLRTTSRLAQELGHIPESDKQYVTDEVDWLHYRMGVTGIEHVSQFKVAEMRTFITMMQSEIGPLLPKKEDAG